MTETRRLKNVAIFVQTDSFKVYVSKKLVSIPSIKIEAQKEAKYVC